MSDTDFDKAYKFHLHADDIYHQRLHFFFVAESMLIISFITSLTVKYIPRGIGQSISIIGLVFTSIWLYTNARLGQRVVYMIKNHLIEDKIYKSYIESTGGVFSKILLTYTLPISINILWINFLCYGFRVNPWLWLIISFLVFLAFSIWMDTFHLPKPPPEK